MREARRPDANQLKNQQKHPMCKPGEAEPPEGRSEGSKKWSLKEAGQDILAGSIKTFVGVVLALGVNSCHDSVKDQRTYLNTLKSIEFEAEGNTKIIAQTFDPAKFTVRPVFRDLNTKIVEDSLGNNTFVERANPELIAHLVDYMNELKRLNAHRSGLEKLYFASDANNITNIDRRNHLIGTLTTNEIPTCVASTTNIIGIIKTLTHGASF